jgi:hypothetical protein
MPPVITVYCLTLFSVGRVRFLSYAGVPFIPGLPSLYLSIKSVHRVHKTNQHLQRARAGSVEDFRQFGGVSPKTEFQIPSRSSQQFHLPLKTSPLPDERSECSYFSAQEMGTDERDSTISMSFPTFINPGHGPNSMGEDDRQTEQPEGVGVGRSSSSIVAEVPILPMDCSVRRKEWTADKDCAESCSRVDFMMSDRCVNGK